MCVDHLFYHRSITVPQRGIRKEGSGKGSRRRIICAHAGLTCAKPMAPSNILSYRSRSFLTANMLFLTARRKEVCAMLYVTVVHIKVEVTIRKHVWGLRAELAVIVYLPFEVFPFRVPQGSQI